MNINNSLYGSMCSHGDEELESDEFDDHGEEEPIEPEKPNCLQRLNERISRYLIDPYSRKMKLFQTVVAVTFYFDILITCLLIGNYNFQIGKDEDFLNHAPLYTIINSIYFIEIITHFFKAQNVELSSQKFSTIALAYIKVNFWLDLLTVVPYNVYYKSYIFLRLIKFRQYRQY